MSRTIELKIICFLFVSRCSPVSSPYSWTLAVQQKQDKQSRELNRRHASFPTTRTSLFCLSLQRSVGVNKRHGSDMLRQVAVSKVSSRHRPSTATRQNRFDFQPLCCCDHFLLKHLSLHSFKVLDSVSQSVVAFAARAFFPFICVSVLAEKPVGRMTHGDGMGEWPGADCRNWNASLQAVNQQHEDDTFKMWQTKKKRFRSAAALRGWK